MKDQPPITGESTMTDLLQAYPGAQRALFARYHIGGCQSCGFSPTETVAQVCTRNDVQLQEALAHVQESHASDQKIQITPHELATLIQANAVRLLDSRTREEHEAVKIPGSEMLTQDHIQHIFNSWDRAETIVIYDHQGSRSIDAAAYFIGHGFAETKCLSGGIDAYSEQVDPSLPRYRLEIEN
jgi:rhodanese-related sulfurtransferase